MTIPGDATGRQALPRLSRALARGLAISLVVLAAAGIGARAWARRVLAQTTDHWRGQLTAMAEDRAVAVGNWVRERVADARTVAAYPSVVYLAAGRKGPPYPFPRRDGAEGHVVDLLRAIEKENGYAGCWLIDAGSRVLARTVDEPAPDAAVELARSPGGDFVGFVSVAGEYRVLIATPVHAGGPGRGTPSGVIALVKDPENEIFGLLRREPTPTRTGETFLARRDGPDIVFLSPLRHGTVEPGSLRLPAATAGLAAVHAVEHGAGFGTFTDHRGATVLAAVAAIPGAPEWGLVVKIDREEALERARAEVGRTAALAGALLLALAGVGFGLWSRESAAVRLALARSESRFTHLLEHAADAVLFIREDGRIARANRRAEELLGDSREELTSLRLHDLCPPEQRDLVDARMRPLPAEPGLVFESELRARDGTLVPVEAASRFLETEGGGTFVVILRDIRERRAAEQRIAFLNRTLRTLSEINQLIVRETDRERLLHEACRVLVAHGGFRMAWIGFRDPQTEWVVPAAWAGAEDGYLSDTTFSTDETSSRSGGPEAEALRGGRSVVIADVADLPAEDPWREARLLRGYRSLVAHPIRTKGEIRGGLALYAAEPGVFVPEVVDLVAELAGDIGLALDVMESRREQDAASRRLAEAKGFLEELVGSSSAAIFTVRPDGRVGEVWNRAAERLFGWRREEVVGLPLPIVDDDHQDEFRALRSRVLAGQRIAEVDVTRVRRDGSPIDLSIAASPLRDPDGGVSGILAVALDVTERARAERRLRQLSAAVEQSPAAIVITDTTGTIEYVNAAFERQTGWARDEAIGRNPRILKSGHHPPRFYEEMFAALARGREFRAEMLNRRKDGTVYWERAVLSPIVDERGRTTHYLGVKEDVTEHRHTEETLRRTQEQLVQSQKLEAVGRLAGGIAHDFNNLLGVVIGHGEMAEKSLPRRDPARRRVAQMLEAARHGADLTRQLLAFSRKQVLEPRVVDLDEVVAGLDEMLRRLLGEDVRLVADLGTRHGRVRVDPSQLAQVLMNLVVNARDAMRHGGTLRIATSDVDLDEAYAREHEPLRPGPYVQLVVSDDGPGMAESVRSRVFEPFFSTKPEGEGSGLGLATVYGIVKQSGGYVWVDSAPGEGATFTIQLPRVDAPVEEVPPAPRPAPPGSGTVLVVEDQPSLRELIGEMLAEVGYEVLSADDGPAALALAAAHPGPVHLLLTDVVMPGMNGRQLLDRLRETRPGMRALFVSGYTNDVIVRSGARLSGARLLEKPFGREDLFEAVREALADRGPN